MIRLIVALLLALPAAAIAAPAKDRDTALAASRAVLGHELPDLRFVDTAGRTVSLSAFRGRPLVVTLVYTACTDACPLIIQNLYPTIANAQALLGSDRFSVVTVGFDARNDTPDRMRAFMRSQGVDLPNWHFLSADQATVDALAEAVGFSFYPYAGGFDHMAQITVADADGRVYRQIYGGTFEAPQVMEPLKDVVFGRFRPVDDLQDLIDRVRLFCTIYDPNSGRYYFDYSLFIGIAIGVACLSLVAVLLVREWRRAMRARPRISNG